MSRHGGLEGLCTALVSSSTDGVDPGAATPSLAVRRATFGENRFGDVPMKGFFALLFENLQDPTLILLMAAALVSL